MSARDADFVATKAEGWPNDERLSRCVRTLIAHDGTVDEECPTPWRWRDEVGEDLSYFRIVEIVMATVEGIPVADQRQDTKSVLADLMRRYDDAMYQPTPFARGVVEYEYRKTLAALTTCGYEVRQSDGSLPQQEPISVVGPLSGEKVGVPFGQLPGEPVPEASHDPSISPSDSPHNDGQVDDG